MNTIHDLRVELTLLCHMCPLYRLSSEYASVEAKASRGQLSAMQALAEHVKTIYGLYSKNLHTGARILPERSSRKQAVIPRLETLSTGMANFCNLPNVGYVRFESLTLSKANTGGRMRVRSDGKVKTSLNVLAKGTQTFSMGSPDKIISDAAKFNQLTQRFKNKEFVYTQHVLRTRQMEQVALVAPRVKDGIMQSIGELLTAVLAFKGKTLEVVRQELKLSQQRGDKTLTYNVNTKITWGEVQIPVGRVTVKKTFADGIFFASETCNRIKRIISGARLTKDGQANNLE